MEGGDRVGPGEVTWREGIEWVQVRSHGGRG